MPEYQYQSQPTSSSTSLPDSGDSTGGTGGGFTEQWLAKFDADFQAMLRGGTPAGNGNRTVSGGATPATPTSSFTKKFQHFSDSLSEHLKNGGSGSVFYNPVMHYDLNSMKNSFTAVNEAAGIYERNGVFYATRDVNGQTLLQPVGIHAGRANGLSDDLSAEQKAYFDQLWEAMKKMEKQEELSRDDAKAKLMETVKDPTKLKEFMEKYGPDTKKDEPKPEEGDDSKGTHAEGSSTSK